jgi:hypothetical protein
MKIGILWHPHSFSLNAPYFDGPSINTYTGHNTGNMAYVEGLRSIFNDIEYCFLPWSVKHSDIPSDIETLIFPAANQLGAHTDLHDLATTFENYQKPVIAIGLGAQFKNAEDEINLTDGTRRWLDVLTNLAPNKGVPNIITRGDFTASVLDKLGYGSSYIAAGCPSQFINLDPNLFLKINDEVSKSDLYSSTYNASHYSWAWSKEYDREALQYIRLNAGGLVVQAPGEFIDLVKSKHFKKLNPKLSTVKNFYDESIDNATFIRWLKKYFFTFSSASSWRSWLSHFDFNYGTRIHGTMLSLQTGIPSFLITHDTRTDELAKKMGVPHIYFKNIPSNRNSVDFVKEKIRSFNFELTDVKRRENCVNYINFFELNNIDFSDEFKNFSNVTVAQKQISQELKFPISNNIIKLIDDHSSRIVEIYDNLSCLPESIRRSQNYTGFRKFEINTIIKNNLLSSLNFDVIIFSSSIEQANPLLQFMNSIEWSARQIIFKYDTNLIEGIDLIKLDNDNNLQNSDLLSSGNLFIGAAIAKGFKFRNSLGIVNSSGLDRNGKMNVLMNR